MHTINTRTNNDKQWYIYIYTCVCLCLCTWSFAYMLVHLCVSYVSVLCVRAFFCPCLVCVLYLNVFCISNCVSHCVSNCVSRCIYSCFVFSSLNLNIKKIRILKKIKNNVLSIFFIKVFQMMSTLCVRVYIKLLICLHHSISKS